MLLFPKPSALKDIYRDTDCNRKSRVYSEAFGPPQVFSTRDGYQHKLLRKALATGWGLSSLLQRWESKIGDYIQLFIRKLRDRAEAGEEICMPDRFSQFTADILTMLSFGEPWGFVQHERDERGLIHAFRSLLDFIATVTRFSFLRDYVMPLPILENLLIPNPQAKSGWGYLIGCARREVAEREEQLRNEIYPENPDFMHLLMSAHLNGEPLSAAQKHAHVTLLLQAGIDTSATALTSVIRFLAVNSAIQNRVFEEIEAADKDDKLSTPIRYEETRTHLPYTVACIKESMRLNPPATFLFAREVPEGGKVIDGFWIPGGTDVTTYAYIIHRDPELYAPDPEVYRPERWLDPEQAKDSEVANFTFGMGPRVCLGKDLALIEAYKLLPEIIRSFEVVLVEVGKQHFTGSVMYFEGFVVKLFPRG